MDTFSSSSLRPESEAEVKSDGRYILISPLPQTQFILCLLDVLWRPGWPVCTALVPAIGCIKLVSSCKAGHSPPADKQTSRVIHLTARLPQGGCCKAGPLALHHCLRVGSGACCLDARATHSTWDLETPHGMCCPGTLQGWVRYSVLGG